MKIWFYILLLGLMASCTGARDIQKGGKDSGASIEEKPSWVDDRPISGSYYIGIGSASKSSNPDDFSNQAKNNALNDLASEISVTIKGESFLNILEVNMNFQEQFISQVNAHTDEYVEGFEQMGSWQDEGHYFVYYRLSKAKHAEIQSRIKTEVLSGAYDSYKRGKESEKNGDVSIALDHYLSGLSTMQRFWNEPNPFLTDNGEEIFLDNEIYHSINSLISGLKIDILMSEITLNANNNFEQTVGIRTLLNGEEVGQIPLLYNFDQDKYSRNKVVTTNSEGLVSIRIKNPQINNDESKLMVAIDVDKMVKNFRQDRMMKEVTDHFIQQVVYVPINIELPKLFIESYESNLGNELETAHLGNALKKELTDMGMSLAGSISSSEYLVQIKSSTTKGGTSQGFHVTYLEFEIEVKNRVTGDLIYQNSYSQVKGLQLNFEAAGMEAYKKAAKMIKKDVAEEIVETIL